MNEVKFCAVAVDSKHNIYTMVWDRYKDAADWLVDLHYGEGLKLINASLVSSTITATVRERKAK